MSVVHDNRRAVVRRHFGRMAKPGAFNPHLVGAREVRANSPSRLRAARGRGEDEEDEDEPDEDEGDDDSDPNGDDNNVPYSRSSSDSSTSAAAVSATSSTGNFPSAATIAPGTLSIPPGPAVTQYGDTQSNGDAQPTLDAASSATVNPSSSSSSSSATAGGVIAGLLSVALLIFVTMFVLRRRRKPTEDKNAFDADIFKRQSTAVLIDNAPADAHNNRPVSHNPRPPSMIERNAGFAGRPLSEVPPMPSLQQQFRNISAVDSRRPEYDYFAASKPQQTRTFLLPTEAEIESFIPYDLPQATSPNPRDSASNNENSHFEEQPSDATDGHLSRQNSVSGDACQAEVDKNRMTLVLAAQYAEISRQLSIKSQRHSNVVENEEQTHQVTGHAISTEDNSAEEGSPFADPPEVQAAAQDPVSSSLTDSTVASAQGPTPAADSQDAPSDQRRATTYAGFDVIDAYGGI